MGITFAGICLVTTDVVRLRTFYEDVLQAKGDGDEVHSVVTLEDPVLAIYNPALHSESTIPAHDSGGGSVVLEFQVDDVDAEHERLVGLGVEIIQPPTTHPWGRRAMQFDDPDGNIVTFYTTIS
jgi:uncharacterized glyoxalase superfamily protein PhnB